MSAAQAIQTQAQSQAVSITPAKAGEIIEAVMIKGDLAALTPQERAKYYTRVCESIGVNPMTRPFEYITLNGKLTLYARKDCTDQLRSIYDVSVTDMTESEREGVFIVTAKVRNSAGRTDIAKGAVNIAGLKGEALANALMKAETKAKRRATLSICGLGFLDETEVEDISARNKRAFNEAPALPDLSPEVAKWLSQVQAAFANCKNEQALELVSTGLVGSYPGMLPAPAMARHDEMFSERLDAITRLRVVPSDIEPPSPPKAIASPLETAIEVASTVSEVSAPNTDADKVTHTEEVIWEGEDGLPEPPSAATRQPEPPTAPSAPPADEYPEMPQSIKRERNAPTVSKAEQAKAVTAKLSEVAAWISECQRSAAGSLSTEMLARQQQRIVETYKDKVSPADLAKANRIFADRAAVLLADEFSAETKFDALQWLRDVTGACGAAQTLDALDVVKEKTIKPAKKLVSEGQWDNAVRVFRARLAEVQKSVIPSDHFMGG